VICIISPATTRFPRSSDSWVADSNAISDLAIVIERLGDARLLRVVCDEKAGIAHLQRIEDAFSFKLGICCLSKARDPLSCWHQ
jgi:hypothetical protein